MKLFYLVSILIVFCFLGNSSIVCGQTPGKTKKIITGAAQPQEYISFLKGRRVGILANQTSIAGNQHLVDFLLSKGINIVKVFGPEHGFRGNASAGVKVTDEKDTATGIKIISLYGAKRKPTQEDMSDIDVMIYDVQDVGCRFYTNINTLRDVMESVAEFKKELLILDRPNPNGYLVDGPVLDMSLASGIGQFPVPIAHGMTIAEFAQMINGEGWLAEKAVCPLKIVKVRNYRHDLEYVLPVNPSPNLNTQQSIMLYPSTCLFEGTILNHGRGTYSPFAVLGSPLLKEKYSFSFTPAGIPGMSETPLYMNEVCYGLDLRKYDTKKLRESKKLNLAWMIELYQAYPQKEKFFDKSFSKQINDIDKLAGTRNFKEQIIAGKTEEEIRKSWEPELSNYKKIRTKYLLYK
jgi:uncharacterized protein YbbC (DUF1343 family)